MKRRDALLSLLVLAACDNEPKIPAIPPPRPLGPKELDELIPIAGLEWVVRAKPRTIAEIAWLIPALARIVPEANQSALQKRLGFDPRQVTEALIVSYGEALGGSQAQLVRHNSDPALLEQRFLERLTKDAERRVDHPEVIRLHGTVGKKVAGLTLVGRDIAIYDETPSGDGVARIAALYATGKMTKAKPLHEDALLASVVARFGDAPLIAVAPGPFGEEWKKGVHGLLEVADVVAVSASPAATEAVRLSFAVIGDFGEDGSKAADLMRTSWQDIGQSTLGKLLGLHDTSEPVAAGTRSVVTLNVMIDPNRAAAGLGALLEQDLPSIMRL